jgi:DHA1 family inner membrane transport protein
MVGSIVGILFVWGLGYTAFLALVGMCVWSAFGMMFHAPQQHRIANMSREHRGLMMALNASALYLGMSVGAWLSREVYVGLGYEFLPLASVGGLLICIAALLMSAWPKPDKTSD